MSTIASEPSDARFKEPRNTAPFYLALFFLWFCVATVFYAGSSIMTILHDAPHALYADQWRQYLDYVSMPFPSNVLHPDNGHRLVLPNLIAWAELNWLAGNQWLQLMTGIVAATVAASIPAFICARDVTVGPPRRAAAVFMCFFAIFWLGNIRTLFHSTELLHTTLPILFLMLSLSACLHATNQPRRLAPIGLALLAGLLATFSFGYGLAVFVGMFGVLIARNANRRQFALWLGGLAFAALLYVALPGSGGVTASMRLAPLDNVLTGARWLGAPWVTLFKYLWDPGASGLIHIEMLRHFSAAIATAVARVWQNPTTAVLPYALFGACGMLALVVASVRQVRTQRMAAPMQALGFGMAWFGLGCAGIVSLSRLAYFLDFPAQIYADRYLPWPCIFWLGLALVALGAHPKVRQLTARAAFAFVVVLPLLAWPLQVGGEIYADLVRAHIDNTAAGSIVGVLERGADFGESEAGELSRGVPVLQQRHVAQFDWPAAKLMGSHPEPTLIIPDAAISGHAINDNLLGPSGMSIEVHLARPDDQINTLLLVDDAGIVVGMAIPDVRMQPPGYSGYARAIRPIAELHAARMPQPIDAAKIKR